MNEDSLKEKLKYIAKEKSQTFNQVWKQLLLERFLARLAYSAHHDKLIFKGGLLLAKYINLGRETMDIDFSLTNLRAVAKNIESALCEIINIDPGDHMLFSWDRIEEL